MSAAAVSDASPLKDMSLLNEYEHLNWPGGDLVMGIDEAGRGPLCGPLVVACCVLPSGYSNDLIDDSKKLTEKKREELFKVIIKDAVYFAFKIVKPKEIDELNIYAATRKAMAELAKSYDVKQVLTDAMKIEEDPKVIPIIKGDAKSISIAAASILAKVLRDHIMWGYDHLHPEYEYIRHKGYPTRRHLELMEKYGIFDIYRMSYRPCQNKKFRNFQNTCQ